MSKKNSRLLTQSRSAVLAKNLISFVLILYTLITIFLIGNAVLSSFKTKADLITNTMGFPKAFVMENFNIVLGEDGFLRNLLNSAILVSLSIVFMIALSSSVAYGISMFRFKGRDFIQTYFLVGLMFPIQLGILPLFVIMNKLKLTNNLVGLALVYAANMSFSVVVFSKFFKGFQHALLEAAVIDGASDLKVFTKIVLPISKPVIFTVGLINFVMVWNDFYMPLVFLTKSTLKTLTLGIYAYTADFLANWNKVFAGVTVALLPIIIIYFFFSEQIVSGLTSGSIKE
jgi:raffinose/stachyose/melibiose transport system permease protein